MATQDSPIQNGFDDASEDEKIAGIVEQTRADYLGGATTDVAAHLQQRLIDAGLSLDQARVEQLAEQITA